MATHQVRIPDSILRKADEKDSMRNRLPPMIPEDGLDSDDEDSEHNHASASWVIRRTFLELGSLEQDSLRFKLYKTDSWLMADRSTTTDSSDREDDSTMCSTRSSSRESSADDVKVTRQRSVRFADEAEEAVQQMKRVPSFINMSSLKSDYSPVRRISSRTASDRFCRFPSKLSVEGFDDAEHTYGKICSIRTDMSPRSRAQTVEDNCFGRIFSTKTDNSPRSRTQTAEDLGFMVARESYSPPSRASLQQSMPASTMLQLVPTPMMFFSPCAVQVRTQTPAPMLPPGNFSQPATPPGKFSQPAAPPGQFFSPSPEDDEQEKLLDQQEMLQEQRRRLLNMSGACASMSSWATPAPQKPVGTWNQLKEQSHECVRQWNEVDIKPHERTTIVLRNLPEGFSRDMIADLLNSQGFEKKFDFIYTPVKFSVMATIGYAFVNMISHAAAQECVSKLDGFTDWATPCGSSLAVMWSEKDQGLATIIDRHRNSPVMHSSVQEEFKPALYVDGVQTAFPLPTKKIKPPRVQRYNRDLADVEDAEQS